MSNDHSTASPSPDSTSTQPKPPPHPLMSGIDISHSVGKAETLDYCADYLWLLADLFGGNDNGYAVLDNASTRVAMWRQLVAVAQVLEVVSAAIHPKHP